MLDRSPVLAFWPVQLALIIEFNESWRATVSDLDDPGSSLSSTLQLQASPASLPRCHNQLIDLAADLYSR